MPDPEPTSRPWHPSIDLRAWETAETDSRVIIADNVVEITVRNGQLSVKDGPPKMRRTRKIPRIPRDVSRVIVLGKFGYITVEAQRWMKQAGISWCVLGDNEIIAYSGPDSQDSRLIRAQSQATDGGTYADTGLKITRYLLGAKLAGQADIAETCFNSPAVAYYIRERARSIDQCETSELCSKQEGLAAEYYWQMWDGNVPVPMGLYDRNLVPEHWLNFHQRNSLAVDGYSNRHASDIVNACLNYAYKIAESESLYACHATGLLPQLGICHADKPGRNSMALDLLETVRPTVDKLVLDLFLTGERFERKWVSETQSGIVRLNPPLTHHLASHARAIGDEIQPHAYRVALLLANSVPGIMTVKRPKTRDNQKVEHHGYPAARLAKGVTMNQVIPDKCWRLIQPLIPPRESTRGRYADATDREVLASLTIRYVMRCPWQQVPSNCHRSTLNNRLRLWQASGAWEKIRQILEDSGHLADLTV